MKRLSLLMLLVAVFAIGCSEPKEEAAKEPPAATEPTVEKPPTQPETPGLGAIVGGAHFGVKVTADPTEPKVGTVKFTVAADHHGQPATGLPVQVRITKIDGEQLPIVDATESGVGTFEATFDIPEEGDYHLEAILGAGSGHDEIAKFKFTATK